MHFLPLLFCIGLLFPTLTLANGNGSFCVTTTTDEDDGNLDPTNGDGTSLREAIRYAPLNSLINFDISLNGQTLILTQGQLSIERSLSIDASLLSEGFTIDANGEITNHRVMEIQPNSTVTLQSLTLTGGNSSPSGGAILNNGSGSNNFTSLTLIACTISNSTTSNSGGGIYNNGRNSGNATLILNACTLSNNMAFNSGAILNDSRDSGNASLTLNTCTLSGNSSFSAGAVFNDGRDSGNASLALNACTVSNNSAFSNGPILSEGDTGFTSLSLDNTILAGNTTLTGSPAPDLQIFDTTITATGSNLISNTGNSGLSNGINGVIVNPEPLLSPLNNHGGPTETHLPLPGSPTIDAGSTTDPGGTDQRGFERFSGDALDIGAVEFNSNNDLPLLFPLDLDDDGIPFGIEIALGTDPNTPDLDNPRNLALPAFNTNGDAILTFGRNINAPAGIRWTLSRSTDLTSFDVIYRFDGTNTLNEEAGNQSSLSNTLFEIIDTDSPSPKAFYRFEAEFVPAP